MTRERSAVRAQLESLRTWGVTALPRTRASSKTAAAGPSAAEALKQLEREVAGCTRCPLYKDATQSVFSDGSATARLVFVGEAPGRDEDAQGKPFVGAAGQLLTKMIEAMGFKRSDVYICNVIKHRPPGNRLPEPEEIVACAPFMFEQLRHIRPRIICALGSVAAKTLLGQDVSITRIRGTVMDWQGIPVVPTFHPAYLLRNPPSKKLVWQDLKLVMRLLKDG